MKKEEALMVRNVLFNSMGLKPKEKFLILTDSKLYKLAKIFYLQAKKLGFDPLLLEYFPGQVHGEEPPPLLASILRASQVALLITSKSLSHTQARKSASQKGARIASLPGITYQVALRTLKFDYRKCKRKIQALAQKLTESKTIRVKSSLGTDIVFSVRGRKGFADTGIYTQPGDFGNLPAGEACIAPREGTAQGIVVIDGSIAGFGRLKKPVILKIEDGYLVESKPSRFFEYLSRYGKSARNLAEFGIGMNPVAVVTGNVLEDEKVKGTAHFAFGTNISFGGKIYSQVHIDAVLFNPRIYLQGVEINL